MLKRGQCFGFTSIRIAVKKNAKSPSFDVLPPGFELDHLNRLPSSVKVQIFPNDFFVVESAHSTDDGWCVLCKRELDGVRFRFHQYREFKEGETAFESDDSFFVQDGEIRRITRILKIGQRFSFTSPQRAVLGRYSGYFFLPEGRFDLLYVRGLSDHHKIEIAPSEVLIAMRIEQSDKGWTVRFKTEKNSRPFVMYQQAKEGEEALADCGRFIRDSDIVLVGPQKSA